jgi:DNA-binding beta-propeller fold protein YncE
VREQGGDAARARYAWLRDDTMSGWIGIGVALLAAQLAEQHAPARFGAYVDQAGTCGTATHVTWSNGGSPLACKSDMSGLRPPIDVATRGEIRSIAAGPDGALYVAWGGSDQVSVARNVNGRTEERVFGRRGAGAGEMREPGGLEIDARAAGSSIEAVRVLVTDTLNHRIDVFGADGTPLLSFGSRGAGDGQLDHPADVDVDARGHAFVADLGNDRIVEFDAEGRFVQSFGGRGSHPGLFAAPSGLDVFGDEVFVADRDNHRIEVFGLDGAFRYEWGVHALLPREGAGKLHYPCDVAVSPAGTRVAVLEELEDRVQFFAPAENGETPPLGERNTAAHYAGMCSVRGDVLALLEPSGPSVSIFDLTSGTPIEITKFGRTGSSAGRLTRPSSVLLDKSGDVLYVADPYASRITSFRIARKPDETLRFDPQLARAVRSVDLASTTLPLRATWTIEPQGMALGADGEILVADVANRRIVAFGADLSGPLRAIATPVDPVGVAFDAKSGRILVTDPVARALVVIAKDGTVEETVRVDDGQPFGVAVAPDGAVWVTDRLRGALRKLAGDALVPVATVSAEPAPTETVPDGAASAEPRADAKLRTGRGELFEPEGVACDGAGRVYVLEAGNHRFQVFDARGKWLQMGGARFYTEAGRTPPRPIVEHAWDGARNVTTNGGTWRVLWRAKPAVVPRGQPFAIEAWVFATGEPDHPAAGVELRVDAWMPDHLHGMNRVPRVVRREDGGFTVEGMLFHMSGAWELDFDVVRGAVAERAQVRVDLE